VQRRRRPLNDKPYTVYTVEGLRKRRRRRVLLWSLIGVVVLILAIGGGSYLWLYNRLDAAGTTDSSLISAVSETLPGAVDPPDATDILVLGSDKRANNAEGVESRSDTIMLVHVDPDSNYLSILSLPRDLRVDIPGHGMGKLNAAYTLGGPTLTMQTVEQLTQVNIEQYLQIDFKAFQDITNALGGVYVDVDRRYYRNDADQKYEPIKLSPGYQLLNGGDALDYVRFRHDLNLDFGRMERQQRFLVAAREQISGWNLAVKLPGLINALVSNVETTIKPIPLQKLALWAIRLDGSRIRQISVIGDTPTIDGESFVVAADGAVEDAVSKLITPPVASGSTGSAVSAGGSTTSEASTTTTTEDSSPFITDPTKIENAHLWSLLAASTSFPVMAPGYLPDGYQYVDRRPHDGETYNIVPGDSKKPGLKMVYQFTNSVGTVTDWYLGIMETSWLDAPAASKGAEVKYNGTTFTIVGTNQKVDRIWWKQNNTLYWVSNTLTFELSKKELLKVAESMIAIPKSQSSGQ
jgi:LCP family protein required for cell wall assembly